MNTGCFHCGKTARWRDSLTGAHRCSGCLIDRGGGRAHTALPAPADEPSEAEPEDTVVDDQDDGPDPVAVWDELEQDWSDADALIPPTIRELVESMLEQGKTQAMELARVRKAVPQ